MIVKVFMNRRIERTWARWPAWLTVAGLIAGYLVLTGMISARRLLWNDELFTYYTAAKPTLRDVWETLRTGAEQSPPFFYVVTRAGLAIFGVSEFSLRVFEMLGVSVAALSVYAFARRRASLICAAAGAIFLLCTAAYPYAYEARPYGIVLAFSGLALLTWQRAAEDAGRPRRAVLAGLALLLTLCVHTHYYAILLLGPLYAAELTRALVRRRVDVPVCVSLAFPVLTIVPLVPLLRAAAGYAPKFWARPSWLGALDVYSELLYPAMPAIVLVAVVACVFGAGSRLPSKRPHPPLHELVAIGCLVFLPFGATVLAKTITGAFTIRYVLTATLGMSVLLAWGLDRALGDRPRAAMTAAALLVVCFFATFVEDYRAVQQDADHLRDVCRFLAATDPTLPVVIASPHLFFKLSHYAPRQVAMRLTYLADASKAMEQTRTDTAERQLMALKQIAWLNVVNYQAFLDSRPVFLVYASPGPLSWVVLQLANERRKMEVARAHGDALLFRVTEAGIARQ